MEFTKEQQEHIDNLLSAKDEEYKTQIEDLKNEVDTLKETAKESNAVDDKEFARRLKRETSKKVKEELEANEEYQKFLQGDYDLNEDILKERDDYKAKFENVSTQVVKAEITAAAFKHNLQESAVELLAPTLMQTLTSVEDSEEKPTVDELVKKYAEENPYLVKTTGNSGVENKGNNISLNDTYQKSLQGKR